MITDIPSVLVQGITGKEGQKVTRAMKEYGTPVLAGVRPGKEGDFVDGVPVFDNVHRARLAFPEITASVVYVPPFALQEAVFEAIKAGIHKINIVTEGTPLKDIAACLAFAREHKVRILGPSSLGYICPGRGRVGMLGGPKSLTDEIYSSGTIGVVSRSGGMTNEIAWQVKKSGLGQSVAVHVGGDLMIGTTYADVLRDLEHDSRTKAVVVFGEHGGTHEFEISDIVRNGQFTKPIAVYIGGKFAASMPEGMTIGHAGAIVKRGQSAQDKEEALRAVGVMIASRYEDLPLLVRPYA